MTHLVQKGSNEYWELSRKALLGFTLAAVTATSFGCVGLGDGLVNTSHDLTQTAMNQVKRGGHWILGSDKVCQDKSSSASQNGSTASTRNSTSQDDCIEPRKQSKYDKELIESQRRIQVGYAETAAQVQEIQTRKLAESQERYMILQQHLKDKQTCLDINSQALREGRSVPVDHICVKRGFLENVNGVVVPAQAKDAGVVPSQQGGAKKAAPKKDEMGPLQRMLYDLNH